MDAKYPKHEKLKSRKVIDALFSNGHSVSKYPIRLVFAEHPTIENGLVQFGVSVSKRNFKHASDRNYFKRVLRETYRLNKHLLTANLQRPYAFMLLYQTKEKLPYEQINEKVVAVFEKFNLWLAENPGNTK